MDHPTNHQDPKSQQPVPPLNEIKSPLKPQQTIKEAPIVQEPTHEPVEPAPKQPMKGKGRAKKAETAVINLTEKRMTRSHGKAVETPKEKPLQKASNKGRKKKEKEVEKAEEKAEKTGKSSVNKDPEIEEKASVEKVAEKIPEKSSVNKESMEKNNEKTSAKKESVKKESVAKNVEELGEKRERPEEVKQHESEPQSEKKVKTDI